MHRCKCGDNGPSNRTHVFVDLNGFPYLLGEYMDRNTLQHVDRSAITSGIYIDLHDSMRAVVDININDIGTRSDSTPAIVGNRTKQKRLLDIIEKNANRLDGQLPVIKSGIVVRINYQLENSRTRQIIRSMSEDLRINDRSYFLDINRSNFNDNAVVVNFNNSMISTINEFTHGRDRMSLRITNVQLFYELVSDRQPIPRVKESMIAHSYDCPNSHIRPGTNEEYYYHEDMQSRHYIGDPCYYEYDNESNHLHPQSWTMFNQFYHFDQDGRRIILHDQEIYDPMRDSRLIPCGKCMVNRVFTINPGHRLIFKLSIWKNDITAIFDTLKVATALKVKFYNCCDHMHHDRFDDIIDSDLDYEPCNCGNNNQRPSHAPVCPPGHDEHHHSNEYDQLIRMLYDERKKNEKNGAMISELLDKIQSLEKKLAEYDETVEPEPDDTVEPPLTDSDCECGCDHTEINDKIDDINQRLDEEDIDPMSPDIVESIFEDVKNDKEGGL